MPQYKIAGIAAALSTLSLANAACTLNNAIGSDSGIETRPALCTPQADGNYQLALDISEVSVPTFDGDNALAGVAGNNAFLLYGSDCSLLGVYSPDNEGNDCGVPYEIDFFRTDPPLTITDVFLDVGDPQFTFDFLGETYSEDDAKCGGCQDLSDGLEAEQGCKCGFYVADIDLEVPTQNPPPQ